MTASSHIEEEIARLAFEHRNLDGQPDGRDLDYWAQAEAELTGQLQPDTGVFTANDRGLTEFERRLNLLHAINSLLATTGSFRIVALPLLETICSVYEWDAGAAWQVVSRSGDMDCVATWCAERGELQEFCRKSLHLQLNPGIGLPGTVWQKRQPVWISDFENGSGMVRAFAAQRCRLNTAFACPLQSQNEMIGAMEFYSRSTHPRPTGFLETMGDISEQIARSVIHHNAERSLLLRRHEMAMAKHIQQGWQPRETPDVPGYDIGGASIPAREVGGDYFDYFDMPDGRIGIAIGDASGHGLDSALNIAEVRAYVRALGATTDHPERILALTNRYFIQQASEGTFVTLLLSRLDPRTGELRYSNAGHLSGRVFNSAGDTGRAMHSTGFPLGIVRDAAFPPGPTLRLEPGEWALLFTDGVIDARDKSGESLGLEGLLRFLMDLHPGRCARELTYGLLQRVADFADNEFDDDITAVIIARNAA